MTERTPVRGKFKTRQVRFEGTEVVQKDGLIDPSRRARSGETSLELMRRGRAPLGPDEIPIQLHHVSQDDDGVILELPGSFHQEHSGILHEPGSTRIDRLAFARWKQRYWRCRARAFEPGLRSDDG
ncbi:MAG: HNH/ENDO VII family nuclease [Planctomycetes bacterium]|nr:HNH/ENDO VII family nuclease [Planctomycetota bacterium]